MYYAVPRSVHEGEMDPTQVLKGLLDTAVLGALKDNRTYGYDLVRQLREHGFAEIADASVYGTLRRLYRAGLLTSEIVDSETGPPRKYYSVNESGAAQLKRSVKTWDEITHTMDRILHREDR